MKDRSLKRVLGLGDAVGVGLGAIIGAGIFVVTGVAGNVPDPACNRIPATTILKPMQ